MLQLKIRFNNAFVDVIYDQYRVVRYRRADFDYVDVLVLVIVEAGVATVTVAVDSVIKSHALDASPCLQTVPMSIISIPCLWWI